MLHAVYIVPLLGCVATGRSTTYASIVVPLLAFIHGRCLQEQHVVGYDLHRTNNERTANSNVRASVPSVRRPFSDSRTMVP